MADAAQRQKSDEKDVEKDRTARKEKSQEGVIFPKPSKEHVSRKREPSSTVSNAPLAVGLATQMSLVTSARIVSVEQGL